MTYAVPRDARKFEIFPALDGQTLAGALKRLLEGTSWGEVKRLINRRHVQVNGNLVLDEARRLRKGDVLHVHENPLPKPVSEDDIRIVHLDDHLVVIDKPAGVTTLRHHDEKKWDPRRKQKQPTLDELLARVLAQTLARSMPNRPAPPPGRGHPLRGHPLHGRRNARGPMRSSPRPPHRPQPVQPPRIYPVHRLDRDTSGLMVFARTPAAETALIRLFKAHDIERVYTAVVHGRLEAQTLETHFVRDRGDGLRGSVRPGEPVPEDAQRAVTHVTPVEHLGDAYTIAECRLETGRTHQIRIHLSEIGHPLAGDRVYRKTLAGQVIPDNSRAPRQALHAHVLGFVHPITGEPLRFETPLPPDLARWLAGLRKALRSTGA